MKLTLKRHHLTARVLMLMGMVAVLITVDVALWADAIRRMATDLS